MLKGVSNLLVKFNALKFYPKQQINTPNLTFSTTQTCLKLVGPKSRLEHLTLSFLGHQKVIIRKTGHSILSPFDFLKFKKLLYSLSVLVRPKGRIERSVILINKTMYCH